MSRIVCTRCFARVCGAQYWCPQCWPTPMFEPNVRCTANGPFLRDNGIIKYQYQYPLCTLGCTHPCMHIRTHTYCTYTYPHKHLPHTCINLCIEVLKYAEAHLLLATQECSYKSLIDMAKAVLKQTSTINGELKPQ